MQMILWRLLTLFDRMSTTYTAFDFSLKPLQPFSEILIAELANLGFESFEETEKGVIAYIPQAENITNSVRNIALFQQAELQIDFTQKNITPQNWNAEWEKDFVPVVVDNRCRVRATFHQPADFPLEIIIDPKMSFGTGHHETTHLMLSHLLDYDFKNQIILDMGCGTGVLGIATALLGANKVIGVDIEPWCIENTIENAKLNNCQNLEARQSHIVPTNQGSFDWILANINRNVLLEQMETYKQILSEGGWVLLSGFYQKDRTVISKQMTTLGFQNIAEKQKNEWVAMLFRAEG